MNVSVMGTEAQFARAANAAGWFWELEQLNGNLKTNRIFSKVKVDTDCRLISYHIVINRLHEFYQMAPRILSIQD